LSANPALEYVPNGAKDPLDCEKFNCLDVENSKISEEKMAPLPIIPGQVGLTAYRKLSLVEAQ
jgi:hypothetical protein